MSKHIGSLLLAACVAAPVQAGTVVVTRLDDAAGACPSASDCTLRAAISAAQPGDRIEFSPDLTFPAVITLLSTELSVVKNLLIAGPGQKATALKDIVALCKAEPGKVSFGSAGAGSAQHLALEMFKLQGGLDAMHVPYKGSGPLLADLMGNQIQYSFETMTAATPHVKSGKVVAVAQTRTRRAKGHPGVPTMQEQGFEGFEATTWYGLVGPGKLPTPIADKVNRDVNTVLAMPDVQERLDTYGAEDGGGTREKFTQFIASETAKWGKVVRDGKVKVDA